MDEAVIMIFGYMDEAVTLQTQTDNWTTIKLAQELNGLGT